MSMKMYLFILFNNNFETYFRFLTPILTLQTIVFTTRPMYPEVQLYRHLPVSLLSLITVTAHREVHALTFGCLVSPPPFASPI